MIRLTLNAQSDPEIHLFNKSTILIGAEIGHVDLVLPGPDIQPIHLKIDEHNGIPILINCMNDPFISINGQPFGKKLLNSGDVIIIHHMTLLFENLNSSPILENQTTKVEAIAVEVIASLLENKAKKSEEIKQLAPLVPSSENGYSSPFSFPFEEEVEVLGEDELKRSSLDTYLKELESIQEESKVATPASLFKQKQLERKKSISLKDDYLRELDDDHRSEAGEASEPLKEPSHLYQAWKWILLFIFSIVAISGVIGTIIYFSISDKAEAQETKAAQGVADVAMALTYAQLNHLKPHNHNWSDADFLKNNIQTILPDTSSYASQIDAQGQFNSCPYSLRIYTSSDLSHFLLIAQPAPSLLNWLIPQSLIVVDSQLMELRTLKDVRSLNRLLANSEPLDGLNGKEISSLIKQGGLIRLTALAGDSGHVDFAPPKNLAWVRPGAENLIYNAPRYYRLGHMINQKAMALSNLKGASQDVSILKQEIENLANLNHFILYSDQGKKAAILARQALMLYAPSDKILFGYLLFNAQGKIHQVHLLKEEEEWKETIPQPVKENDLIAFQSSTEATAVTEDSSKKNTEHSAIDTNHPIYIQLQALLLARENELHPLTVALSDLIEQELQIPHSQFQVEFQTLSLNYLMTNAKHKQAIKTALDALYHQYENIPLHQFLAFMKALNLDQLIQEDGHSLSMIDENGKQNIELLLTHIENSQSLAELDHLIYSTNTWLDFDFIKDPNELMKYQNLVRNRLLEQLEHYLLSEKKHLLVKSDDKEILKHLLSQERLIKSEEKEFFLREFDELLAARKQEEIASQNSPSLN